MSASNQDSDGFFPRIDNLVIRALRDLQGVSHLRTALIQDARNYFEKLKKFSGVDSSEIIEALERRISVTVVAGRLTLAHRSRSQKKGAKRQIIDKDILTPALGRPRPGLALVHYVRQMMVTIARELNRRAGVTRKRAWDADCEPADEGENLALALGDLLQEIALLPPDLRVVMEAYLENNNCKSKAARRLGVARAVFDRRFRLAYGLLCRRLEGSLFAACWGGE